MPFDIASPEVCEAMKSLYVFSREEKAMMLGAPKPSPCDDRRARRKAQRQARKRSRR